MGSLNSGRLITGWAARDPSGVLSPYNFTLRKTGPEDVLIKVLFCGICHSDIDNTRNYLGSANYPMVPGHEAVGEVVEVGSQVTEFKVGDVVGAGLIVGSCQNCEPCKSRNEQYCGKRIWAYGDTYTDGSPTQGGFASHTVVDQKFVMRIPDGLALEQAAPLLCAGITIYSPLKHLKLLSSGLNGAILGLGGVGHMGVKLAKAMGHHVTVISSSDKKRTEAMDHLKADQYLVSSDKAAMAAAVGTLDYIMDTVPAEHALDPYLRLLKVDGVLILLGVIDKPLQFASHIIGLGRKSISGSFIGSMDEQQEMLEFCKEKGIESMVEVVKMDYVNKAFDRLEHNDVRYRFVIDVGNSNLNP